MNLRFNENIFSNFPLLESKRLIYRQVTKKDAGTLFKIRSNPEVMKYMDIIAMKSLPEAKTLIKSFQHDFRHKKGITWAIELKDEKKMIGSFAFWRIIKNHCRAEFGYSLLPEYWGKGYMEESFQTLIGFAFKNMGIHSLEANVNPGNDRSIRLLERFGFRKEAYFRENFFNNNAFTDSVIYCLLETDARNY